MNSWHSYPKIYNIGHAAVAELFSDPVIVEEKVDGSQFSFGRFVDESGAEILKCRSRGAQLNVDAPDSMFQRGVQVAKDLLSELTVGWTYRGEYLAKPKHNTLAYDRAPEKHVIIFDINTGEEAYMPYADKKAEAARLGLETVPIVFEGIVEDVQMFRSFLEADSVLGGQKIEGVVAKNYSRFAPDGKVLMGKFVSEAFKEVHAGDWKERNPKQGDIIQILIEKFRTPARWAKSVQHLREAGSIEDSPRDIGKLIPEVSRDLKEECGDEIAQILMSWAWPQVSRGVIAGCPEWYKDELLKLQFEREAKGGTQ